MVFVSGRRISLMLASTNCAPAGNGDGHSRHCLFFIVIMNSGHPL